MIGLKAVLHVRGVPPEEFLSMHFSYVFRNWVKVGRYDKKYQ